MIRNIEMKRTKFHENMAQKHSSTKYNGKLYLCLCKCADEKYANFRPTNQAKTLLVNSVLWVCSLLNYVWKLHDERSSISIWINIDFSIIKLRLITVVGRAPIECGLTFSFSFWFWIEFSLSLLFLFSFRTYVLFFCCCSRLVLMFGFISAWTCAYSFTQLLIRIPILEFIVPSTTYCTIEISFPLNPKAKALQFNSNQTSVKKNKNKLSDVDINVPRFTVPPKSWKLQHF